MRGVWSKLAADSYVNFALLRDVSRRRRSTSPLAALTSTPPRKGPTSDVEITTRRRAWQQQRERCTVLCLEADNDMQLRMRVFSPAFCRVVRANVKVSSCSYHFLCSRPTIRVTQFRWEPRVYEFTLFRFGVIVNCVSYKNSDRLGDELQKKNWHNMATISCIQKGFS